MTIKKDMLPYDISLLLLRYGRTPVLGELAHQLNIPEMELLDLLERMRHPPRKSVPKKRPPTEFSVKTIAVKYPEIAELLISLEAMYENRTFLPELRDVKRFLEKNNHTFRTLKSRQVAKKPVFGVLTGFDPRRLTDLTKEHVSSSSSSLGIISDQILRR